MKTGMSQNAPKTARRSNARSVHATATSRDDAPPPTKKLKTKPLVSISRPPMFDLTSISSSQSDVVKGKGKEKERPQMLEDDTGVLDNQLWVDKYQPTSEAELAVHKRKVQDVRQWLLEAFEGGPTGKLRKYRRILALTGPSGTAKTATIRVLAGELGYEILEWRNTMDEQFTHSEDGWDDRVEYEGLSEKFQAFLTRAASCRPIFAPQHSAQRSPQSTQASGVSQRYSSSVSSSTSNSTTSPSRKQIILLEDLPNILHLPTQASFHAALEAFVSAPEGSTAPLVIIISDAGLRGENAEGEGPRWRSRNKEALDVRSVLPPGLANSPYVMQISFNPIAVTIMRTALKNMLDKHYTTSTALLGTRPTKEVLDVIVESSNGDIRSAIMALQFACTADTTRSQKSVKGSKKGAKGPSTVVMLEAVTRREQSLALFHLLGKIMYNKRKGDSPPQSASAKDIKRDKDLDAQLLTPRSLPPHLHHHERKPSRVDVEMLYADTPIDASLLSLYIHQNYTQYCNTLDECSELMDSLSWVDANGGSTWYQANPHQFHMVALGTLHALPTPVPRRNQKPYKPAFFETLRKQHEADDGVRDVQMWLQKSEPMPLGTWSPRDIALGLGRVLRMSERTGKFAERVPHTYRLFADLEFGQHDASLAELAEEGDASSEAHDIDHESRQRVSSVVEDDNPTGANLSDDDIEQW